MVRTFEALFAVVVGSLALTAWGQQPQPSDHQQSVNFKVTPQLRGGRLLGTACNSMCPFGTCCSQYGYCGGVAKNNDAWCGTGCQPTWTPNNGCYGSAVPPVPAPSPTPTALPSCIDTGAECPSWGPSSCIYPGVPEKCPKICGKCSAGPSPAPQATPVPSPPVGTVKGSYFQTWYAGKTVPSGTNLSVAFGGWSDVTVAMSDANGSFNKLVGDKYLDIGGGDTTGRFSAALITKVNSNLSAIKNLGYVGICYDIEEGDTGLASAFTDSFKKAKAAGLKVLVTISHSQPYGISDAAAVMTAIIASPDVDYISPQLYTSGKETVNDFTAQGTQWSAYANAKGKVVPSIASAGMYDAAKTTFATYGVTTYGYMAWQPLA